MAMRTSTFFPNSSISDSDTHHSDEVDIPLSSKFPQIRFSSPTSSKSYNDTSNSKEVVMLRVSPESNGEESLGIMKHSGPARSEYSTVGSRLKTFAEWPPSLIPRPKELSEAGFYYTGKSDQVRCFSCDGDLRNWSPEDDPWTEHARWYIKCEFVRLIKGDEFIKKCCLKKPTQETQAALFHDNDEFSSTSLPKNVTSIDGLVEPVPKPSSTTVKTTTPSETQSFNSTVSHANKFSVLPKIVTSSELENRMLKEKQTCKICTVNEIGVVFLPCGHLGSCTSCAAAFRDCPFCRALIKGTVRTFKP